MNIKRAIAGTLLCATSLAFADPQTAQSISDKLTPALGEGLFVKQLNSLNIYTVAKGNQVFFTDSTASFLMKGDIVDVKSQVIISDVVKSELENSRRISNAYKKSKLNSLSDFGSANATTDNVSNKDLSVPFDDNPQTIEIETSSPSLDSVGMTSTAETPMTHPSTSSDETMPTVAAKPNIMSHIKPIENMNPKDLKFGTPEFASTCLQIAGNSLDIKDLYNNFREMNPQEAKECGLVFGGFKLPREDDSTLIVYKAENEKRFITIISDFTCHFCGMLHKEVDSLNEMGVTVKIWPYGRAAYLDSSNVYTMTAKNMVMATCQPDNEKRKELYDELISNPHKYVNVPIANESSVNNECANKVLSNKIYGEIIAQRTTPIFMFDDGTPNIGYINAKQIAERLGIM